MNGNPAQQMPVELKAIYVRDSVTMVCPEFNPTVPGQMLSGEFRMTPTPNPAICVIQGSATEPATTTLGFMTRFEFRYRKGAPDYQHSDTPAPDDEFCAKISVDIIVDYILTASEIPPSEAMRHWSETAVLTQAWPYWREHCQTTMLRMHLPVMMVPLLRVVTPSAVAPEPLAKTKPARRKRTLDS